ncbi:uncharacterized protein [Mytilus edulis]|uniref:uncharacterized protein n=1 Tax=Mytilus edulis TaxID=6550 RepID=UPI0039F0AB80
MSDLYDTKTELQNGIDQVGRETKSLRHDVDNKFTIFTSQVQQILASYKQEVDKPKNTTDLHSEFNELMQNHTKLQHEFETLKSENAIQQQILLTNQNKTIELAKQIVELKGLKNIQQLGDLHGIQQEIKQLHSQTQSLSVNERARSQDFQALYKMTLQTEASVKELNNVTAYLNNKVKDSNITLLSALRKNVTDSLSSLKRTVLHNDEKVAMTACVKRDTTDKPSRHVVKFDDISTSYNIKNISAIRNIGKFEIEIDGLYLISASIFSRDQSNFSIRKNGEMIATGYISSSGSVVATAVVAIDLKWNDEIWVQTEANSFIYSNSRTSCLTLIKVK